MMQTKLYHCTKIESLKSILREKAFRSSYCLEQASYLESENNFAFAVVCFADLMDTELKEHMRNFNSNCYIEMSKEWARKKKLSNVIYYGDHTLGAFACKEIVSMGKDKLISDNDFDRFAIGVSLFMALLKPYKGYYWDKTKRNWSTKETVFYNEREWRYIPLVKNREHYCLEEKEFKDDKLRNKCLNELNENPDNLLRFDWDDIVEIGIEDKDKECLLGILASSFNLTLDNINKIKIL